MIGKSSLIWFALACLASAILYHTSYQVQAEAERLASLRRQISAEQDSIQVLKAEWAYLNDPKRIERLARQHTALKPLKGVQIAGFDVLPLRTPADPPATMLAQQAPMLKPVPALKLPQAPVLVAQLPMPGSAKSAAR